MVTGKDADAVIREAITLLWNRRARNPDDCVFTMRVNLRTGCVEVDSGESSKPIALKKKTC